VFRGNTAAEEPVGGSKLKTRPHRESGEFCDSRAMDDSSKSRTEQNPPATSMPQPAGWPQHAITGTISTDKLKLAATGEKHVSCRTGLAASPCLLLALATLAERVRRRVIRWFRLTRLLDATAAAERRRRALAV